MGVVEKRKYIQDHCCSTPCNECLLNRGKSGWCPTHSISLCDESDLDEALKILGKVPTETTEDLVNHPNHYTNGGMECIEEMILIFGIEATMNFCLLNAWKYRYRSLHKNGQQDLDKSHWYINKYKELKEHLRAYGKNPSI